MDPLYYFDDGPAFYDYFKKNDYVAMHTYAPRHDMHRHEDYFELGYIADGVSLHTLNGEKNVVQKGDFFILDQTSWHSHNVIEPVRIVNLLFHPRFIDPNLAGCTTIAELVSHFSIGYLPQNISRVHWQVFHDRDGEIAHLINSIAKEQYHKRSGINTMIRTYMIQLLVAIMRELGDDEINRYSLPVRDTITQIEKHYFSSITLQSIASKLNYSSAHLSRTFTKEVGKSFSEYLKQYRLERASYRLITSSLPVCKIAESVGYNDMKFFYRLFKKTYGLTPIAYRQRFISNRSESL